MNRYILNIGLLESTVLGNGGPISADGAIETVRDLVGMLWDGRAAVTAYAVHQSDTEPTLVVEIWVDGPAVDRMEALADLLAVRLRQEAVAGAAMTPSGRVGYGFLRGPMADRWGDFSPEYFLLLDGHRAAEPVTDAA